MKERRKSWNISITNTPEQRRLLLGLLNPATKDEYLKIISSFMEPVYMELAKQAAWEEIDLGERKFHIIFE